MWIILVKTFVSAGAALLWCLLVTFCCMYIEHLFFKRRPKPALSDKEIILIKEVLAGNISLPLVANDGLFVQCVDRIEHIFGEFIAKTQLQTDRLENLSGKWAVMPVENTAPDLQTYPLDETDGFEIPEQDYTSGLSIGELIDKHTDVRGWERQILLDSLVYVIGLPPTSRNVFRKRLCCRTVKDVLQLMLYLGSREALLGIHMIGPVSADRLESFMMDGGLMYLQDGTYESEYRDRQALQDKIMSSNTKQ